MDRNLQLLGIARKAGLIAVGSEAVATATRKAKARLVLSASDSSEGALRRALSGAKTSGVVHVTVPYTKFELGQITGRGSPGTVAVLDAGLAAGFLKGLAEAEPERYSTAAQKLESEAGAQANKRKTPPRRTAR